MGEGLIADWTCLLAQAAGWLGPVLRHRSETASLLRGWSSYGRHRPRLRSSHGSCSGPSLVLSLRPWTLTNQPRRGGGPAPQE